MMKALCVTILHNADDNTQDIIDDIKTTVEDGGALVLSTEDRELTQDEKNQVNDKVRFRWSPDGLRPCWA